LIVGAGFSGLVVAERLSAAGFSCIVADRRDHLGGNAYDTRDAGGVLHHPYGPHYFRTNSRKIADYLGRFTGWHPADYRVKVHAGDRYWSFPVNLETFEQWIGRSATEEEFKGWLEKEREPVADPANSEEAVVSRIGRDLYRTFFEGYTLKQWGRHPRDLDPSVCARIPIRTNRDDRYLRESFQALPKDGYTAMFGRMVEASPGLQIHLGMEGEEARRRFRHRHLVFTGAIDEFYGRRFGPLPYRSLRFEVESFGPEQLAGRLPVAGKPGFWQPALQVNYPDPEVPFTRIVELKHATGQKTAATAIVREFPLDWTPDLDPYYPIPASDARARYEKYAELAARESAVTFVGRLANYRYFNMDQVTALALETAEGLAGRSRPLL
jgi:UDP-galactopyranose mutase